jgi:methionyl-tRNA formyltransferase
MRIAALGRTGMLLEAIKKVAADGHRIVLVGTNEEAPEYGVTVNDFAQLAGELGAIFFNRKDINSPDVIDVLKKAKAELAISVNWPTLLGKEALDCFEQGVLNAHAGDLPRYRGNACPNWAILNDEEKITVCIHKMMPSDLDSGPIMLKQSMLINTNTTIGEIYKYLHQIIPSMFAEVVNGIESKQLVPVPQPLDPTLSLRCFPRVPSDGLINWDDHAVNIDKLVRASSQPFGGAYTFLDRCKLIIWKAFAEKFTCPSLAVPGQVIYREEKTGNVGVATAAGVLVIQEVETSLGGPAPAYQVITSSRIRLGMICEDEIARINHRLALLEGKIAIRLNSNDIREPAKKGE